MQKCFADPKPAKQYLVFFFPQLKYTLHNKITKNYISSLEDVLLRADMKTVPLNAFALNGNMADADLR